MLDTDEPNTCCWHVTLQLLVAEVQSIENAPQLHTRSLRYGKVGANPSVNFFR